MSWNVVLLDNRLVSLQFISGSVVKIYLSCCGLLHFSAFKFPVSIEVEGHRGKKNQSINRLSRLVKLLSERARLQRFKKTVQES